MADFLSAGCAGFIFGILLGLITAAVYGYSEADFYWREQATERGLGQYCPNNGEWAWKGECDE